MAQVPKQKPATDRASLQLKRLRRKNMKDMILSIIVQLWLLVRILLDALIDKIFGLAIYDDTRKAILPKVKNSLVLESAVSLAGKIRNKEVKSEDVVRAFIDRAEQVSPVLNSFVDNRFEKAIEEAKKVDEFLENGKYKVEDLEREKPFLGVPFTTKESVAAEGLNFTFGLVARVGEKGQEDADVVKFTKNAGGILLGVTNVPELNLWCETRNNVYGQTSNPYNTTRTVGGSSGGEASLIASCGSALGIGTDIGGSIRMPAFFCGVWGHKPTTGLTSMKGTTRRTGEERDSMVSAGPITKHVEDLKPFLKVLIQDKVSVLRLDEPVNLKNINVFYVEQSNDPRSSKVCPELTQALRKTVHHCQDVTGKTCKKLDLDGIQFSYRLWRYWMTKEPYQFPDELGNREREVSLVEEVLKKVVGKSEFTAAGLMKLTDCYLPQENPNWAEPITEKLRHQILDVLGDDGVLLYPSHPATAPYHYSAFLRPFNFSFWAIFNVLNLPVTQVPLGLSADGLPLGIQVVSGPYNDHLCLAVAEELSRKFGGWVPPFVV